MFMYECKFSWSGLAPSDWRGGRRIWGKSGVLRGVIIVRVIIIGVIIGVTEVIF